MNTLEEFEKLIESVESASDKPPCLFAYSDYEEQKFKEYYPGVEVIRVPLKINIK